KRVRTGHPRTLLRPDVPRGLISIIERCLARERSDRFPDAAALHEALSGLAAETRAWAPPADSAPAPAPTTARQRPPAQSPGRPARAADETTGATVAGVMSPAAMANLVASIVEESGYAPGDGTGQQTTTGRYAPAPRRSDRTGPLRRLPLISL